MKRIWMAAIFGLGVAASCAPLTTYYKPGVAVDRLNRDTTACQVAALRDVPASTQVRRLPPEFIPPRRRCDSAGNCTVVPGYYIPGETISFDPNDGLRKRVEQQCMADRGYAPVSIPPCPDNVARAAPPAATRVLPALGPESCAIRNRDGSFQIVNRG
ncbi:hypothetical protein PVW51_13280 [Sulfitobacter sp. PR48]|jgi:hypothetical protein|uniref:hypothetical protein n=1 Tax=unclassified Sulfitobacter TaxID=196795 RepID=UPI000DF2C959|nr:MULTISPECIES: hypothetical protein [unclassified Sulfitobacter]MCZ4254936.1 hypothetical protein [Sulfitobacter sp. G21635-S1]MDD9721677.1 hypothetical protein [Sulfitobacter sp. PR48]